MISLIAFAIAMLSFTEGLKCGVKYDVSGKFSQDTLDSFDCVVEGQKCVYAECLGAQSPAWPKFADCKHPDSVNCTHLTRECEALGGKGCCYVCGTDLCNSNGWNCGAKPSTPEATTSTTASTVPPPTPEATTASSTVPVVPAKTTSNSTMKLPDFTTASFAATSETSTATSSAFRRENIFCAFLILFIVIKLMQ
ncbi:hypothetical protein GPALN_011620 [Globodera pallida]|nr:hypothetical protein GPALN_011620 [Globodera pallida]